MARNSKDSDSFIPVDSLKHKDGRPNIPTEELRDFVTADETSPSTMLYPRDPSLDPQLVWKGKDEQDRADLSVPVVPVYIQEKIHPQALVENLRDTARAGDPEPELTLFADFNGIEFEELIDFYQHEQHWANRMILGDSLLVMTSLAEKEGFKGKVQTIYLDPPYGIKFGSNWQVSTRKRDVKDGKAEDATRQPEQIKAFRDTWELGIHSYLTYLRDRLVSARELLTESGSIFVQIGAGNLFMVFGEPDIDMHHDPDGRLVVEIHGLDVYDPTTGEIRSSSTDDIACWFIDTDYNEESFFVRHAYFTGADEPYQKLQRALRAEIDEAAWSSLYSTRSRPFDPPSTGKIAVKVINHYGDEVLKVYPA